MPGTTYGVKLTVTNEVGSAQSMSQFKTPAGKLFFKLVYVLCVTQATI